MLTKPNPRHYTPDHEAFRATVRRFVEREIIPNAAAWDEAGGFPRELYAKAAAAGLLANASDVDGGALSVTAFTVAGQAGPFVVGTPYAIAGVGSLTMCDGRPCGV